MKRISARMLWVAGLAALSTAALAQPGELLMRIEVGLWQLKAEDGTVREVCVSDPARLIQMRHEGSSCTRLLIANEATNATVHYSCPGAGWGRTTLRQSGPRALSIDTQGIADNAPFAFKSEARRIGECARAATASTPAH